MPRKRPRAPSPASAWYRPRGVEPPARATEKRPRRRTASAAARTNSPAQEGDLVGRLDTDRDDLELQRVRHGDHGAHRGGAVVVPGRDSVDERGIDLQRVEREAHQVAEGGQTGAEAVDRQPDARLPQI